MAHRWKPDLTAADVTPAATYLNRRQMMAGAVGLGLGSMAGGVSAEEELEPNDWNEITTYNNFYEFGTDKGDPVAYADALTTTP